MRVAQGLAPLVKDTGVTDVAQEYWADEAWVTIYKHVSSQSPASLPPSLDTVLHALRLTIRRAHVTLFDCLVSIVLRYFSPGALPVLELVNDAIRSENAKMLL